MLITRDAIQSSFVVFVTFHVPLNYANIVFGAIFRVFVTRVFSAIFVDDTVSCNYEVTKCCKTTTAQPHCNPQ